MFQKVVSTLFGVLFILSGAFSQKNLDGCNLSLSGKVTDTHDGSDLSYSSLFILELQRGEVADEKGNFKFSNLCEGEYTLIVMHIGCEPDTSVINLTESIKLKMDLEHHAEELAQTNIIAFKVAKDNGITSSETRINNHLSSMTSIAALSSTVNGVSMLQSGTNVAKPVIHGLHSNRITMVNNDVALEGQNWGIEHAPEIDPFAAERLTVVKGASALRYGTSAIGGTIIVLPDEPIMSDYLIGQVYLGVASNNRKGLAAFKLNGRFEHFEKWNFGIQGSLKKSGTVNTPRYYLHNTGMEEFNYSWTVGYQNGAYTSTVLYSQFNANIGVFSGAHIGNLTDLENALASDQPRPEDRGEFSYALKRPYQHVEHETIQWKNVLNRKKGDWQLVLARQFNLREEFDKHLPRGSSSNESVPEFAINLESYTGSLIFESKMNKGFQYEVGLNGITQVNRLKGSRSFIPAYIANGMGAYTAVSYNKGYWESSFGARLEQKNYNAEMVEKNQIVNKEKRFITPALTAEVKYNRFKLVDIGLNYTFAQRAPGINELFSDGIHHGVAAIEYGDEHLNPESSQKVSGSLAYISMNKKSKIDLTLYSNWIRDFIYLQPKEAALTIRGAFPVYQQQQTNAFFTGADLSWNQNFTEQLALEMRGSYLYAQNVNEDKPLIFMPANRVFSGLSYTFNSTEALYRPFVQFGVNHIFEQKRVPLDEDFANAPSAYSLLSLSAGGRLSISQNFNVFIAITIENLTNRVYRDYMNRFRYYADEMGRNISLNVRVPFLINTKKIETMNNYFKNLSIIIGLIATTFTACKKDEADDFNPIQNEEELITSVVLTFVDSVNIADTSTFAFRDPDGEGGNAPTVFDTINLLKGKTYFMSIAFLDESNPNDVEDITVEIKEEDDEHIVCYELLNLSSLSYSITDSDGQFPVGLEATFRTDITQVINNGSLKVTLKHQPGVKDGSCAPGDTDVEINFPTLIN